MIIQKTNSTKTNLKKSMKRFKNKLLLLLILLPFGVFAQNTISGIVLEKTSGQPIPGVNIKVSGGNLNTSTDFDGKFQLSGVKPENQLIFSYTGYTNLTMTVGVKKTDCTTGRRPICKRVSLGRYGSVKKKDAPDCYCTYTKDLTKEIT